MRDGEAYDGIRKDTVHVGGRLTVADDHGPFGNPTSDSARAMVTAATVDALVVVYAPASVPRSRCSGCSTARPPAFERRRSADEESGRWVA